LNHFRKDRLAYIRRPGHPAGMPEPALSDAKRRLADLLKRLGPATAARLARELGLTAVAVRQHLVALEEDGLVASRPRPPQGRGRPSAAWELTDAAARLFPDSHGELTVGLLAAMRDAFGEKGLERVVRARGDRQVERYRARIPGSASLAKRVEALAAERSAEGYLAEVVREKPGSYLLIEHHCPICEAARCCLRLCGSELEVFQRALGDDAEVERTAHLLSGDERCVYRIRKR
jgi:predicted ArsR family transcriptional regulator